MKVFKLSEDEVEFFARLVPGTATIHLAYDEIDGGIKIKFDNGVWSPVLGKEV